MSPELHRSDGESSAPSCWRQEARNQEIRPPVGLFFRTPPSRRTQWLMEEKQSQPAPCEQLCFYWNEAATLPTKPTQLSECHWTPRLMSQHRSWGSSRLIDSSFEQMWASTPALEPETANDLQLVVASCSQWFQIHPTSAPFYTHRK